VTQQSNRFTRKKLLKVEEAISKADAANIKVVERFKALVEKATPEDIAKAEEEGWARTAYTLVIYDEIEYTGPGGGRLGANKVRRKHPLITILSAGSCNRKLESKALLHAAKALKSKVFVNEDGLLEDGKKMVRFDFSGKSEMAEVEYKTLLPKAEPEDEEEEEEEEEEESEYEEGEANKDEEETETDDDDAVVVV
jgi:hypothetical protein